MTNQEAIETLKQLILQGTDERLKNDYEAIDLAIKALEEKSYITECRNTAIEKNLPLYFIYHEESGILEVYETATNELFEKRHCVEHLSGYEFKNIVDSYLDNYSDWKGGTE